MPIDADTARRFASGIDPALAARGFDFLIAADQLDEAAVAVVLVQESELVLLDVAAIPGATKANIPVLLRTTVLLSTQRPSESARALSERQAAGRGDRQTPAGLFGRRAVEMLFLPFGLLFGLLPKAVAVLGRSVDGIEQQRLLAGVDEVMPRARGHDDGMIFLHLRANAVDHNLAFALLDAEELVAVIVHLLANLVARLQRHQHELHLLAGVEDTAEIAVLLR
jgi:hypothetical protein